MVDWVSVEEAKIRPGLRIVLAKDAWGGFSEAVKNMMHVKKIPYVGVPQVPFGENLENVAWTGIRNNPVAVYDNDPPRDRWLDILNLVERLAPEPSLLPRNSRERALVVGIANEILGENGLIWSKRIATVAATPTTGLRADIMKNEYRADGSDAGVQRRRMADVIAMLVAQLKDQKRAGSRYLVGNSLTAVDIYWASMSNLFGPFEPTPLPEATKAAYSQQVPEVAAVFDPILMEHRDYIYRTYLPPISFS